jgi:citrate lyase subunit beta / citryl-CoA lyase
MNPVTQYLMRSLMFVPAHNERLMKSAVRCNPDVYLLDLEDSVQPVGNKIIARENIIKYVQQGEFTNSLIFPRINDRESGELLKDLTALTIPGIEGFMCPKSVSGDDIYFMDKLLETIEYEKDIPVGTFKLIPLIETAGAVLNAQEICQASKRVVAIAFGCEDFVTDLEGRHDSGGQSIFTPRAIIAMAARANKVIPIDTVHINVHDFNDLEINLQIAKNLGFEGMLILNPKELPLVHEYFSPSQKEIADANEMVSLAAKAYSEGKGVSVFKDKFVGPPMVNAAKKILEKNYLIQKRLKS